MTSSTRDQVWEVWYPDAGATGLLVARARIAPAYVAWLHAAPDPVTVTIRDGDGAVVARVDRAARTGDQLPMTRLAIAGDTVTREDRWPTDSDLGAVVVLPGGESGILASWWNAEDGSEWRWAVEFRNRR